MARKIIPIEHPFRQIADAWATVPIMPDEQTRAQQKETARQLLKAHNAVLVAHYYVDADLQMLAEETGGFVGDSLDMARFGHRTAAETIIVAGVRFMGETAKILNPNKRVLMPDLDAVCSLDVGCPADEFQKWRQGYPDRVCVVYANTSAAVKACADWVVTSSIALDVVRTLHQEGKKILWAPDKHLGAYIQQVTGADILPWKGSCVVHDEFQALELAEMKQQYPQAKVLAHPESPAAVVGLADVVGSTSAILKAARTIDADTFIIATDFGIRHQLEKQNPTKRFLVAPTAGRGATCKSCAFCPWMAMNTIGRLIDVLQTGGNEIHVDPELGQRAQMPLQRMIEFGARMPFGVTNAATVGLGPA